MLETERYSIERVGKSAQPVVTIDNFHPEFDRLKAAALTAEFARRGPHYPGLQAPADPRHLQAVAPTLTELLQAVFGLSGGASLVQCSYSMVTTRCAQLTPIQRLPHVDTTNPGRIALLHYLSGEETGGTAFYRHRATGSEILTARDFAAYQTALEAEGVPKPGYMRGSDDRFEMIGHVPARPNRAVIYRSHLLHSGMIPKDLPFSDDPGQARLTLNSFFQAQ